VRKHGNRNWLEVVYRFDVSGFLAGIVFDRQLTKIQN